MTTAAPTTDVRSKRLQALPPYLFVEIDRARRAKMDAGADVINLGVGDPDRPTPAFIIDALDKAARDPATHQYAPSTGTSAFRAAAGRFMKNRFGVDADPDKHICQCIGSKDGIAHLPLAVVNPGDVVLVPKPGYPVYESGAVFAGAEVVDLRLTAENDWKPRLDEVPEDVARRARLIWANYPNNPTAACVDLAFFEDYVAFAAQHNIIAASDHAYSEVWFDAPPPSMWQAANADLDTTLGIEFHSLSKTFNMTGWRCAFAVGHPEVIAALAAVKGNCDSGQFAAVQAAGAVALDNYEHADVVAMREVYRERRDVVVPALKAMGCDVQSPEAGFFVWARCPVGADGKPMDSMDFVARVLDETDVVLVPGAGFGEDARTFFRIALTVEVDRLEEAMQRLARLRW